IRTENSAGGQVLQLPKPGSHRNRTDNSAGGPVLQHAEPGSHRNRNKQFCWWPSFATCRTGISPQPKQTVLLVAQFCNMQNRDLTATETNSSAGGPVLQHEEPTSHRNFTETNSSAGGPVLQHAEPGSHRNRNKQFCWWPSFATCRTGISPQLHRNKQFCWWPSFATCKTGISPQLKQTELLLAQLS